MSRLVVVGVQWGDEGKGKMTDYLAQNSDVVVRYQGGNNAGHTITFKGQKYALQSIPSGIFNPTIKNVMANGMVINPKAVLEELRRLNDMGITDYRLFISDRASVVMPYHLALDGAYEGIKGSNMIGTTKKGIGPAYADKYNRIGIRIGDLLDRDYFALRLREALTVKNMELRMLGLDTFDFEPLFEEFIGYGQSLSSYICDTSVLLNDEVKNDSKILFEGAQGVMLCVEHGTYPFVTSSNTTAAGACTGLGVAPRSIGEVIGIFKAYTTRVGSGPFPTELFDEVGETMTQVGREFGATTGRRRRCGWLDLVALKYAVQVNGVTELTMMKADVLSGFETLKVCTSYLYKGKEIKHLPYNIEEQNVTPVYTELKGWQQDLTKLTNYQQLPKELLDYISFLEKELEVPIKVVSVGPDRTQTIIR